MEHLRITVAVEKKISLRLVLSVGITFNLLFSPYDGLVRENLMGLGTRLNASSSDIRRNTYGCIGFQAGLRLCNRMN